MWSIWQMSNNIVFRGACADVSSLMNQTVYIFWFWFKVGWGEININVIFSDLLPLQLRSLLSNGSRLDREKC
jgi:hypothetical protein